MSRSPTPRRILLTGFEPFGGEPFNPSEALVSELATAPDRIPGVVLSAHVLPVDRARLADDLERALRQARPDLAVLVGQATGRPGVDLECRAHNRLDYKGQSDNGGHRADGDLVRADGPRRLDSSLPLGPCAAALRTRSLPVAVSRDAGSHLCNAVLYTMLDRHPEIPAVFVHVPMTPEQAERRAQGESSLPLEVSRRCLHEVIRELAARTAAED